MRSSHAARLAVFGAAAAAACAPRPATPRPERAAAARGAATGVFADTALFRRVCIEADSGLTPAARRCTPRDQRVVIQ